MPLDPPAAPLEACEGSEVVRVRRGNRWRWLSVWALADYVLARQAAPDHAQDDALADLARRLAVLEGKPEEAVPLSGAITIGALSIGTRSYTISDVAGIKAGDRIVVQPVNALPAGLAIAAARAPSDRTVEVTLAALVALTGTRTIPLAITALR